MSDNNPRSIDIEALEAAVEDKLNAAMPCTGAALARIAVEEVLRTTIAASARPIDTAPIGDGWILGYVPYLAERRYVPWVALTWGDNGWMDDEGNPSTPTLWCPLPDPQPKPTGWRPVEGTVCVAEITGEGCTSDGKPIAVPWRWIIDIERIDGSRDEYRDFVTANDRATAERKGAEWGKKHGLPVVVMPLGLRLAYSGVPITKGDPA